MSDVLIHTGLTLAIPLTLYGLPDCADSDSSNSQTFERHRCVRAASSLVMARPVWLAHGPPGALNPRSLGMALLQLDPRVDLSHCAPQGSAATPGWLDLRDWPSAAIWCGQRLAKWSRCSTGTSSPSQSRSQKLFWLAHIRSGSIDRWQVLSW
jgi:hypothetical protein